jgi:hypothetical protein
MKAFLQGKTPPPRHIEVSFVDFAIVYARVSLSRRPLPHPTLLKQQHKTRS